MIFPSMTRTDAPGRSTLSQPTLLATGACALLITAAVLIWLAMVDGRPPSAGTGSAATQEETRLTMRGVAIQLHSGYSPMATYLPQLKEIRELGADTVLLCAAAKMEHARAQAIFIDSRETPSATEFAALIREANGMGLRVIVMPIVLLRHPRGSEWRGVIEPPDWRTWWEDYRDVVRYFADIAREGGAWGLMIGSELVSTEKNTAEWHKVIELARELFPGQLGYSANWDHYRPIQFWNKLDYVGMTSYYTLARRKGASVDDLVKAWEPIRRDIITWRKQIARPLILTEVGWCSQEGAATAPWNYYQNMNATTDGHEEQRRLYEAFVRAWDGTPGLSGVIWWEWTVPGGENDHGYTPRGKPAEQVLREWFRQSASPPAAPASGPATP